MVLDPKFDPMGHAIADYHKNGKASDILIYSDISEEDIIPIDYLFRNYDQMPAIERKALDLCTGKTLDVGCGAGIHSVYLQDEKQLNVTALDISFLAIETCKNKGIKNTTCESFFNYSGEKFDTLLMLMNGTGICGTLDRLNEFLSHAKSLLKSNGQILIDSSDIIYMFEDEEGGYWVDLNSKYYGEVEYVMKYNNIIGKPFNWLFVDFENIKQHSEKIGFTCEKIHEGDHFDYLAKLTIRE